jgi:hypothetical protein
MAVLTLLFAGRVAGQAIQTWAPQSWLPPLERWQGSSLDYSILLGTQLLMLAAMAWASVRAWRGVLRVRPTWGRILAWLGAVYMAGSVARIVIGLVVPGASPWFSTWIPAMFHLVLASFVLALARYHSRR